MSSLEEKKRLANIAFVEGDFEKAKAIYTECLAMNPDDETILSNRAVTHLKLEEFEDALNDARKVLTSNPAHTKAVFRAGSALIGLQRYDKALEILSGHTATSSSQQKSINELAKQAKRYTENRRGQYDLLYFLRTGKELVFHDIVDYFGPLKIEPIPGKGRGIVATKDIAPGQLLIVSKAFAISFSPSKSHSFSQLLKIIVDRLFKKPVNGKRFYRLYAGPELGYLDPEKDDCSIVDINRVSHIVKFNSFGCFGLGLWIEPSFLNNDCFDFNAIYCTYGDVMMVRAVRSINAGDEVTTSYTVKQYSYLARKKTLQETFGFECRCSFCRSQRAEPANIMEERGDLLEYFLSKNSPFVGNLDLKEVQRKLNRLDRLCRGCDPVHRAHYMFDARFVHALVYADKIMLEKAINLLKDLTLDSDLYHGLVEGYYATALTSLLYYLHFLGDVETAKEMFPVILDNFEMIEGKVGVEGFKIGKSQSFCSFIDKLTKE